VLSLSSGFQAETRQAGGSAEIQSDGQAFLLGSLPEEVSPEGNHDY